MNIWGLCSNFVDCESFFELNSPDNLALCETNLNGSIYSGNFFVRAYLPLIQKDSSTHMHGLAVYVKVGLPFAGTSCLCFRLASLYSVSYFFFLYQSPFSSLCSFWFHFFFNCYLAAPRPNLGHYRGDSLTHPMLITAFYNFDPKVTGSLVARLGP